MILWGTQSCHLFYSLLEVLLSETTSAQVTFFVDMGFFGDKGVVECECDSLTFSSTILFVRSETIESLGSDVIRGFPTP